MKRVFFLTLVYLLAVSARGADIHGSWTARVDDPGRIHVEISESHNRLGHSFDPSVFSGLTAAQMASETQTPVNFEMRREAGLVSFRGYFERGEGVGHFTFTPDRSFLATLTSMGLRKDINDSEDETLFSLAMLDVSSQFIRDMRAEGYDVDLDDYISMRVFSVTRELLAQYRKLGFDRIPHDQLIAMRVHGVTPDYIESMRAAGFPKISLDDLVTSRIHAATPAFLQKMAALGYANLDFDQVVAFRIHGVSPDFIRELHDLGYDKVSADDLVRMRIHGVSPRYIRELKDAGYSRIPVEKLIEMRIHGIDGEFARKIK